MTDETPAQLDIEQALPRMQALASGLWSLQSRHHPGQLAGARLASQRIGGPRDSHTMCAEGFEIVADPFIGADEQPAAGVSSWDVRHVARAPIDGQQPVVVRRVPDEVRSPHLQKYRTVLIEHVEPVPVPFEVRPAVERRPNGAGRGDRLGDH
mgnify:CR=1 FL=1